MNLGLSGALSGLSAAYPGYVKGRISEDQATVADVTAQDAKRSQLAKVAMGNALALLAGGGQGNTSGFTPGPPGMPPGGQQPQPPMPGQPSQPMMQPGARPSMGGTPNAPQAMPPGMMPPRPGSAPGGMPGGAPGGMPGGMPGSAPGGMPSGGLDWRQLVAAVKQANPNLPPDVMAEAVNQFLPMMTQQSKMEWQQISLQLREQALQDRMQQFLLAEGGRDTRAAGAVAGRENVAAMNVAGRQDVADTNVAGREATAAGNRASREGIAAANRVSRETIAKATLDERQAMFEAGLISKQQMDEANRNERGREADQRAGVQRDTLTERKKEFETREARLQDSLQLRKDSTWARLDQQKQAALQRVQDSQGKMGLAAARAAIDAQDKHVRTIIQAYSTANSLKTAERKALLDQADADYKQNIEQLKKAAGKGAGAAPAAATTEPTKPDTAQPGEQPPPEAVKQLKEGIITTFGNGQKWTLKNGKPEQVP